MSAQAPWTTAVCQVCGSPVAYVARDLRQTNKPGDTWETWEPLGPPQLFCDEHKRPGRKVYVDVQTGAETVVEGVL
jgi:hypothetical protein